MMHTSLHMQSAANAHSLELAEMLMLLEAGGCRRTSKHDIRYLDMSAKPLNLSIRDAALRTVLHAQARRFAT